MRHLFGKLGELPGIYLFKSKEKEILYVGKAKNLKKRISSYFSKGASLGEKTRALLSKTVKIETIITTSEIESLLLEAAYIKKYKPYYNIKLSDDKFYPYIKITRDKYPKVLITRSMKDKKSDYFGPYPNVSSLKLVLKIARKIFPFQSVSTHPNKPCLYNHLGLCPCPYVFDNKDSQIQYARNIRLLKSFLRGRLKSVERQLLKERKQLVKTENFEKAEEIQKKIDAMRVVTSPFILPQEYDVNPNLREDIAASELAALSEILNENGVAVSSLYRIECYDVSNISGKHSTGSMVVFTNGEKDTSQYRKFRIRLAYGGPNDFLMMEEVLRRRFNNTDWQLPDLIIVDGGKGQISSVLKVIKKQDKKIPVIGLAKKEETIITDTFKIISLSRQSQALKLIMRIRDEAHRFAISYHRKLRHNYFLTKS